MGEWAVRLKNQEETPNNERVGIKGEQEATETCIVRKSKMRGKNTDLKFLHSHSSFLIMTLKQCSQ